MGSVHATILLLALGQLVIAGAAFAFPTEEIPTADAAYLDKVKTAAPEQIVAKATIIMTREGKQLSLQIGSNGYTCLIDGSGTPLCADENAIAWMKAHDTQTIPANQIGFIYMLAGDAGANNHDPYGESHQHWVQTGPHVMVVGPMVRDMPGYPRTADVADPTQPYVMWPGTPYEHLMLPVTVK